MRVMGLRGRGSLGITSWTLASCVTFTGTNKNWLRGSYCQGLMSLGFLLMLCSAFTLGGMVDLAFAQPSLVAVTPVANQGT